MLQHLRWFAAPVMERLAMSRPTVISHRTLWPLFHYRIAIALNMSRP
ncbi:MAG: hypothetical protein KUG65_07470 [Sphingomonadaceae bacterium]|nr:hypothetical protein [Sphingomonadaceae bacterium]